MPIVIHTELEDSEFRKAVKEAFEAEIKHVTRETLDKYIEEIIKEKSTSVLSNMNLEGLIRNVIVENLTKMIRYNNTIGDLFQKILREEVNNAINERLTHGKFLG